MSRSNSNTLYLLIALAAVARLLPHPWNVTPVGALGLFSGAYMRGPSAWLVPVAAVFIGDVVLGFYDPIVMLCVYLGSALSVGIGRGLLFEQRTLARLGGAVLVTAVAFYLISNFGVWLASYPHTVDGLLMCYFNGLPFLGRTLAGDAFYSVLLFGLVEGALVWRNRHENAHAPG